MFFRFSIVILQSISKSHLTHNQTNMQTLFKFLPILLAMFLAQPVVAQNNYVQLIFYNHDTSGPDVNYTPKPIRRSPTRIPSLPTCYFDGETITFTSDNGEFVLPYSIIDDNGIEVMSGTITHTSEMSSTIDVSMLPLGSYILALEFGQKYYTSFERE